MNGIEGTPKQAGIWRSTFPKEPRASNVSAYSVQDCANWIQTSPSSFLRAAPLLLALACEKYSLPYEPPQDTDDSTAWLEAIKETEGCAIGWALSYPRRQISIDLSTKEGGFHRVIDVAFYSKHIYILAISSPSDWSSEAEAYTIRYADMSAGAGSLEPLYGPGLGNIYGGFVMEEARRIMTLDDRHFIVVAEKAQEPHISQRILGHKNAFQIALFTRESVRGGRLLHCLDEPRPPKGANEYDLSVQSVHNSGDKVAALVKWRDRDVVRPFLIGRRGQQSGSFSEGLQACECVIWSASSGQITNRIAFAPACRYAPNIKLLSESVLLCTIDIDGVSERTNFVRLDRPSDDERPKVVYKADEAPIFSSSLGLRHICRDEAIDSAFDLPAASFDPRRHLASGGLIAPDRFLLSAVSGSMTFASAGEISKIQAGQRGGDPLVRALAELPDFSMSQLRRQALQLTPRMVIGFRAIFSTKTAKRSGLLARRQDSTDASQDQHYLLECNPDYISDILLGRTNARLRTHMYRIRTSSPPAGSSAWISDVTRRLSQAVAPSSSETGADSPSSAVNLPSPWSPNSETGSGFFTPFNRESGYASVNNEGVGHDRVEESALEGWTAIIFSPIVESALIKTFESQEVWSDGRYLASYDASSNLGRGSVKVTEF